jgi:hypothetical protein
MAAAGEAVTARQLAEADETLPDRRALTRYGNHLRALREAGLIQERERIPGAWQQGASISYVITGPARQAVEDAARQASETAPRAPAVRLVAGTHWRDASAAARSLAGEALSALAEYGVGTEAVTRALHPMGIGQETPAPPPRRRPETEWGDEAARRYLAGETRVQLTAAYKVGDERLKRALTARGVELRGHRYSYLGSPAVPAEGAPPEDLGT